MRYINKEIYGATRTDGYSDMQIKTKGEKREKDKQEPHYPLN